MKIELELIKQTVDGLVDDVKLELDSKPHTLYNIDRAIAKLGTVSALIIELHGNAKISCSH